VNKAKLKSRYHIIVGDIDQISSERHFVTLSTFIGSFFLMMLCIVHIIMGLKLVPVIIAGISSIVMLSLYYFVRFRGCLYIPKVILTGLGLIMLDITWYNKFMSNGPVLFFILIFAALVIWVWEGKCLAILLAYYFLNLAVLGFIDSNAPDYLFKYPQPDKRSLDIYLSFFLYSSLLIILLYLIKKEFIRQREKAINSDQLKSAFLANMSHEIRTPMNAIVGFSELLGSVNSSDNKQQYISIIQNSSNNLLRLINDIIDLSKIEAGDLEIKYSDINLRDLFIELKDLYSIELVKREKSGIKISYILPDEDLIIQSDPLRLRQVLSNLLNNAVKFTARGSIIFRCERKAKDLVFSVSDTGTGIPEEDQKRIFDRFTKFNYNGMNTEGSGIGLAIVERIVTLLNGKVWFDSVEGEGTNFFFSLPYLAPSSLSKSFKRIEKISAASDDKSMKHILVVEDDEVSFMLIKELLRSLSIEVHHVTDGRDAISFVKANPDVSFILMDIKLPSIDGYEATRTIKQTHPGIPVIAQTAYAMTGDREKAIAAGCVDYIDKPLNSEKLVELVRKYLTPGPPVS
jgi:signal transduction histidine kinase/CheY-like chemotaxis protein